MSRSTNASKGSPDDDEGRLDDASDEVSDAVEDSSDEDTTDDAKPAAASKPARQAAKKRETTAVKRVPAKRPTGAKGPVAKKNESRGPIAAIVLFVRQVIAELRKVVTPTTKELWTYSAVATVFVLIVMAYVGVLDFAVGKLVLWAFGG